MAARLRKRYAVVTVREADGVMLVFSLYRSADAADRVAAALKAAGAIAHVIGCAAPWPAGVTYAPRRGDGA
jgi:hypothetical protein